MELYIDPLAKYTYHYMSLPMAREEQLARLQTSTTVYIGNLSFFTTEEQIYEAASRCGEIKRLIMGLNKLTRKPCGFCFVEFYSREAAEWCTDVLTGLMIDERIVKCEMDVGFTEGRQYGRSATGGQLRDELRSTFDFGRGGHGMGHTVLLAERAIKGESLDDDAEEPADAAAAADAGAEPAEKPLLAKRSRAADGASSAATKRVQAAAAAAAASATAAGESGAAAKPATTATTTTAAADSRPHATELSDEVDYEGDDDGAEAEEAASPSRGREHEHDEL